MEYQNEIVAAIRTILYRHEEVKSYQDAVAGRYSMTMGSDRFRRAMKQYSRMADNLCPRVVSAVADRLTIKSIDPETPSEDIENLIKGQSRRIRFDALQKRVHFAALRDGSAYLVASKDRVTDRVQLNLNTADMFEVARSSDNPDQIVAGVKLWHDGSNLRLTVYYADRVERWFATKTTLDSWYATILGGKSINLSVLRPYDLDGSDAVFAHGFDTVPVVAFLNQPDERLRGVSELASVLPIQIALNAAVINLLSAMEAWSVPTRYILGLLNDYDESGNVKVPDLKPGGTWVFGDSEISVGQLPGADLRMAIESINDLRHEIARVSGIPIHALQLTTSYPSGEALKVAEGSLIGKIKDRQVVFGNAWEDCYSQLLLPELEDDLLNCRWESAEIVSQLDSWQSAVLQRNAGVSLRQILSERGYTDPEIDKILADRLEEDQENQQLTARLFNGGNLGGV